MNEDEHNRFIIYDDLLTLRIVFLISGKYFKNIDNFASSTLFHRCFGHGIILTANRSYTSESN